MYRVGDLTHLRYRTTSPLKLCRQRSNGSLSSVNGDAICRAWIGKSQDIDLNSRHVGSNLFRTNRRWWLSICSITPGKLRAIRLHRQLYICSRSSFQAVLCHACEVFQSNHCDYNCISSKTLLNNFHPSPRGCYRVWSMGRQLLKDLVCICPALSELKQPQALSHLLRIRPEYEAVAQSARSAWPYHGHYNVRLLTS